MRLGLLGGTFDPVHFGHLLLAEQCRQQCQLDAVWFVPAAIPPHKQDHVLTSAAQRVEMLELALGGNESLLVCTLEVDRGGVSYTVDTLAQIREELPDAELFLLMGADSLDDLPKWREPQRICELSTLVVVRRAGASEPDFSGLGVMLPAEQFQRRGWLQVEMPMIELSSQAIRRQVAAGQSIRYQTTRAVEMYIRQHGIYRGSRQ